jgi:hypothetical protein
MTGEIESSTGIASVVNRLYFLYKVVEDTQTTIRFLDTKAVFCVTLLSGMAAVVLGRTQATTAHRVLLPCFLTAVVISLLVCLRVIFPIIQPSINYDSQATPKFYIGHNKAHHWLLHVFTNPGKNVLSESHESYLAALQNTTDEDLLASMCDTTLVLAGIRQVKSDRLHTAMFCLMGSVILFAALVLT